MDAQESQIYIAVIIAVLVFAIAMTYFFLSILKQNRKVRRLERINAEAEIQMLEKERARIAADLHDELAPLLTGISLSIKSFDLVNEIDKKRRVKTNDRIDELSNRMRAIAFDLMPHNLLEKGLVIAVDQFIGYVNKDDSLAIRLSASTEKIDLNKKKAVDAYRIVQEIIHNTIRHAQASELKIVIEKEKDWLVIGTRDNGRGFNYKQKLEQSGGLGLKSIMNRIYLLRAEFIIDSQLLKGTSITIRIPLK